MSNIISRHKALSNLTRKSDGHLTLETGGKTLLLNQDLTFKCIYHGEFESTLEHVFKKLEKGSRYGCRKCEKSGNFGHLNVSNLLPHEREEMLDLLGVKILPDYIDNHLNELAIFECKAHGHRFSSRYYELTKFIAMGKQGCSECRAKLQNDWESRLFNNKTALKSVRHNHTLMSVVPIRRNVAVLFRCDKHGAHECTFSDFLKKEPCPKCAVEGDTPLEAYFKANYTWRNKYV